ncbi:TetR family transcriptional regulator [Saccharothrix sp. NRRL B-16348]|uniref:TetR/AcrR family transcriptional regulator n=1 Tax=Saccharothrix sp. NRRL B-16348 TaxID=1415542 RepID=UPI0006AEC906|nr:TetR/AcrR family transcriptional regulator [Saccharothrix sp. NRRL B-16348]KOX17281.1 TetR family transcriptional regulator [Saccharothrix sp. NRRL B-16348]
MGKAGDPDRGVELLWEERPALNLRAIVGAAVEVADAEGLAGLSMRKVAERLGFTTMSLYRHVPGRDHLVDLMRDAVLGDPPAQAPEDGWRARLETFARAAWDVRKRHPWLAERSGARHVPGPNALAHYEHALAIVVDTGLAPAEVVAAVGLVARFVDAEASALVEAARAERSTGVSDEEWWGARDTLFARFDRYPTLTSLWESGGFDQPDPFGFGLARVLDGIELLVRQRDVKRDETCQVCGNPVEQPTSGRPRAYCSRACQQRAYRGRRSS